MAQGQVKKPTATSVSSARSSSSKSTGGITRKGLAPRKPKSAKLARALKMNKKFTSGLTAQTEKMLGERAGHLELLGQDKKKKEKDGKKGGASNKKKT